LISFPIRMAHLYHPIKSPANFPALRTKMVVLSPLTSSFIRSAYSDSVPDLGSIKPKKTTKKSKLVE